MMHSDFQSTLQVSLLNNYPIHAPLTGNIAKKSDRSIVSTVEAFPRIRASQNDASDESCHRLPGK